MNHPYQCTKPVTGDAFCGRQNIISGILDDEGFSHAWVIGTRRSGKTSLLQHLRYLVKTDKKYTEKFLPVYWNMHLVQDESGLHKSLIQGLDDLKLSEKNKFEMLGLDFDDAQKMKIEDIFHKISLSVKKGNTKLLLLCDEVEALIKVSENDDHITSVLRQYFQSEWTCTVITATGALYKLKEENKNVSPFLSGFVPPQYILERLSTKDALVLVRKGGNYDTRISIPTDWEDQIIQLADHVPYYIQAVCKVIYETKPSSLDNVVDVALDPHDLDSTLENDLNGLSFIDKIALLYVVENPKISIKDLRTKFHKEIGDRENLSAVIKNLRLLAYMNETRDHNLFVQNCFLQSWYSKNLRKIIEAERNADPDAILSAKNHPRFFGEAWLKFRELEALIHTYIGKKYEIRLGPNAHYKKEQDFEKYVSQLTTPPSFNNLITFIKNASRNNNTPLYSMFRDQKEENYRINTLYVIKDIRNAMAHLEPPVSNEEIKAVKLLSQEMINYFTRVMPH